MAFADSALSHDAFLGGRLRCWQPKRGFRAGTDTVLLAASIPAAAGAAVLELGCGAGVGLCCLGARVAGLDLAGLELQADYADLARRNLAGNGLDGAVTVGDVTAPPPEVRARTFDHVFFNPPYFSTGTSPARDPGRDRAQRGDPGLIPAFAELALRRLKPGGRLAAILPAAGLGVILTALDGRAGATSVLPVAARAGRTADRVIVRARKGARAPLTLLAPLILHAGAAHDGDRDDFSGPVQAILRSGAGLSDC